MTALGTIARRAAAGTLVLAICSAGGLVAATSATAAPGFNFDTRFGGATRIDTAVDASKAAFDDGAETVVVVNSDRFADGLTASYAAGNNDAPILYVDQNGIPDQTRAEIERLGAKKVIIVGGTAVVPQRVQDDLDSFVDDVQRLAGKDRFTTAAKVATSGTDDVRTVFIANGDATADALAAGPIAYRSHNPIVLVQKDSVPASAKTALDQLTEMNRIVVGGTAVVSEDGYAAANASSRISSTNRQRTAIELARYAIANEDGFASGNVALVGAQDRNAADALVAAPVAGKAGTPILFTEGSRLGADTATFLRSISATLTGTGYVFGGRAAVPRAVATAARTAAGGDKPTPDGSRPTPEGSQPPPVDSSPVPGGVTAPPPVVVSQQSYAVTSRSSALVDLGAVDPDDRTRTYEATTATPLTIALVDAVNVAVAPDGTVSFAAQATTGVGAAQADPGSATARLDQVNGGAISPVVTTTASPVDGKITFRVMDSSVNARIVPVAFTDDDTDDVLDIDPLDGKPVEKFGVGGAVTFLPAEAQASVTPLGARRVVHVDEQAGYYTDDQATYKLKAGDDVSIEHIPVSLETFLAHLSGPSGSGDLAVAGDDVNALVYAPGGRSAFDIYWDRVAAPTDVVASLRDHDTTLRVLFERPSNLRVDFDGYAIFASEVTSPGVSQAPVLVADGQTRLPVLRGVDITDIANRPGITPGKTYAFSVRARVDGEGGRGPLSVPSGAVTIPVAAAPQLYVTDTAPFSSDAAITDVDGSSSVSLGDQIAITFSEPMRVPTSDASITVTDADGTVGELTNGQNASFERGGSADQVITIAVTAAPTIVTAGTTGTVALAGSITGANGLADSTGVEWAIADAGLAGNQGGATGDEPLGVSAFPGSLAAAPFTLTTTAAAPSGGAISASYWYSFIAGAAGAAIPGATITVSDSSNVGLLGLTAVADRDGAFNIAVPGSANLEAGDTITLLQSIQSTATTRLTSAPSSDITVAFARSAGPPGARP